ncbi:MAG TPA: AI-2E family transporter [Candidatus Dormibacteraeota bacterium]|nr:AI-2E family transporter [Candidatus Dormibacteraeota bacterium]
MAHEERPAGNPGRATLLNVVIVVAALYFARLVFIPIALAILLSFLLAPLVLRLRHWGLGRVPSTLLVVLLSFLLVGVITTVMASQMTDVAKKIPEYQQNIRQKLQTIRKSGGGLINRVTRVAHNVTDELTPAPPPKNQPPEERPVPVEIHKAPFSPFEIVQKVLGSVLNVVLMLLVVIVFVIFMLIQREDLRDRLIRLGGAGRLHVTTQALDDAAHRLSRYLLAQLVVNISFGVLAGIALYFVHVPNPFLWGMVAALLRYVPYLGIWIAAALPAMLAFALEQGWVKVPVIFGIYFAIDLLMYNFVEPYLYGSSTGISPLAILVAAVFWTWLWGGVGLLLAMPLTVCLAVVGRHVPSLEFLGIILSDDPVLRPETRFYQRMLAMDLEEAAGVAEEFLKGKSLEEVEDVVIIPALSLAEEDRHRGRLEERREQFILENTRIVVEHLAERAEELVAGNGAGKVLKDKAETEKQNNGTDEIKPEEASVVCIPARDEADEIAAKMLEQLLLKRGIKARSLSCASLAGECLEQIKNGPAKIACVAVVPPFGYMHARYLCRRLRAEFPDMKIVAAVLTEREVGELRQRQPKIIADELASSLKEAMTAVLSLLPTGKAAPPATVSAT